jgi:hypothetical protein
MYVLNQLLIQFLTTLHQKHQILLKTSGRNKID